MPKKPTGYHVQFWHGLQYHENGCSATGWCEETAHSEQHLAKILKRLNTRMNVKAEVTPLWGPVTTPHTCSHCSTELGYFAPFQAAGIKMWGCKTCCSGAIVDEREDRPEMHAADRYLAITQG